ncbi:deleted in malignant brain tumors 1 protein [Biomphalaria pfeifferi]|uniref:Deleted in malignant brain tumors 1 protein n=1 Tax=Biomphalaria pfeifferi TaxID=112525 RepID=A0AAD8B8J4_BIOPF|nr:deleted in malignant brain tumors 1 protein [Biomphalaria pfeifferi]
MKAPVPGRLSVILLLLLVPLVSVNQAQEEFDGSYLYGESNGVSSQGGPHREDPQYTQSQADLLEVSLECGFDYLNIYDEWNIEKPLNGRFCSLPKVITITTTSNELFITFTSDSSVTEKGFRLEYTTIHDYPTNEPVDYDPFYLVQNIRYHHSLTEPMGNITSPNYPGNYDSKIVVTWLIVTDPRIKIELTFQDVSMSVVTTMSKSWTGIHLATLSSAHFVPYLVSII